MAMDKMLKKGLNRKRKLKIPEVVPIGFRDFDDLV